MKYRRFRRQDGRFLDALLTVDADEFSTTAESHRVDHEAGYKVGPLEVVETDRDPWDGRSELLHAPPRVRPQTKAEAVRAAMTNARTLDEIKAALLDWLE